MAVCVGRDLGIAPHNPAQYLVPVFHAYGNEIRAVLAVIVSFQPQMFPRRHFPDSAKY